MRIFYGTGKVKLYWTVRVTDAKKNVVVEGKLMDALRGTPGQTIGCHLSHCAVRNSARFPHECILASFTKGTCAIVDKVANGAPSHCYRYLHSYAHLVELNDTDRERAKIMADPSLAERSFLLRAPVGAMRKGWRKRGNKPEGKHDGTRASVVPRGALARARKAGLVTADLANALNQI